MCAQIEQPMAIVTKGFHMQMTTSWPIGQRKHVPRTPQEIQRAATKAEKRRRRRATLKYRMLHASRERCARVRRKNAKMQQKTCTVYE